MMLFVNTINKRLFKNGKGSLSRAFLAESMGFEPMEPFKVRLVIN